MSHIYRELAEIPIPEKALVNNGNNRVFISTRLNGKRNQVVIGRATSKTTMHPNTAFKYHYPDMWEKYYGEKMDKPYVVYAGMYALTLAIGYRSGLYQTAIDAYNPVNANAIMDYAMYSILCQSSTTHLFQDRMANQVHFSEKLRNENWYGGLFQEGMNDTTNRKFQDAWVERCKNGGITHVWLSIDGSNSDYHSETSELAEKGKAKSHTSSDIISYIWAIDAEYGTPITYRVNNGSMVDSRALAELTTYLNDRGITIDGVILDRGFCTHEVIELLKSQKQEYIIMLKSNTFGHTHAYEEYAEEIRWNIVHIVADTGVFGISTRGKLFKDHDDYSSINLYFDAINGGERAVTLIKNVMKCRREINQTLSKGKQPTIPSQLEPYLKIERTDAKHTVITDSKKWQKEINEKGFYSIASSQDLGPQRVYELYHKRDASEKQFSILKTHLDFDAVRVHSDKSVRGRFAICFIAAIIRSEIMTVAKNLDISTNKLIVEINRTMFALTRNEIYCFINNLSQRQKKIIKELGLDPSHFETMANRYSIFISSNSHSQIHPDIFSPVKYSGKKRGRKPKIKTESDEQKIKRKPGRPIGSKDSKPRKKRTDVK